MDIFNFDPNALLSFYLTLFRLSVILFLLPFFGGQSIPNPVKGALLIVMTLAIWPEVSFPGTLMPANPWAIGVMFFGEIMLGLILGLLVRIIFGAVQMGGQLVGFQMGFAMVNVVDPLTGTSEAITAHFLYMCTMLTFLSLNGPLHLLKGLSASFELVPPGGLMLTPELVGQVFAFSNELFILAIKIAAPVMVALFLVDLSLALIARAAPQMHVLVLGFPIKISVGFFFLGFLFTIMADYIGDFIGGMGGLFREILKAAHPG